MGLEPRDSTIINFQYHRNVYFIGASVGHIGHSYSLVEIVVTRFKGLDVQTSSGSIVL
jgi:hypothetical protein